ncbi:hypothetical protein DFH06DRAFT_1319086 [Mycena polygramma]|nr:hypothetical protein DFH06DRAFT_1319086 [Mycena polygramma]
MPSSLQIAEYLRVAAYGIAFFDYLQTLPAEYRLYSKQRGPSQLSVACILFILVRYLGLITIITGNTGFLPRNYWLAPIFKVALYTVSQGILGIRCTSGNLPGVKVASLFPLGALIFDIVTMTVSSFYLWKFSNSSRTSFSQFMRMMLHDGLMYFVALSAGGSSSICLHVHEDASGNRIHSSGTPRHDGTSGFRAPADRDRDRPDLVVTVMKSVISMTDMRDDTSESAMGKGQ